MTEENKQEIKEEELNESCEEAVAEEVTEDSSEQAVEETDEVSPLLKKIDELSAEVEENKNRYMRSVADFENFRKRALRDKEDLRKFAASAFIEDILPSMDNMKLGLESSRKHHPEAKVVIDGFEMVVNQLNGVLGQHGVVEINPIDSKFDPNLHECVAHVPHVEAEEGQVIAVQRVGYSLNERLLRPAQVVVSSGAAEEKKDEEENSSNE